MLPPFAEAGGGTARRPLPHNYVFYLSAEASPDPIIVKMTEGRPGGQRVVLGGLAACAEVGGGRWAALCCVVPWPHQCASQCALSGHQCWGGGGLGQQQQHLPAAVFSITSRAVHLVLPSLTPPVTICAVREQESVHAGITWAAANIQRLGPWLLPRQRVQDLLPCVVGPGMDLSVCFPALAARKRGSSASAAVAVGGSP